MNVRDFVDYCRKSRVVRVAFIYVPAAWVTLRAVLIALPGLDAPDWIPKLLSVLLLMGYPVALIVSWAMDVGDEEDSREAAKGKVYVPGGRSIARTRPTTPATFGLLLLLGMAILGGAGYLTLNPRLPIGVASSGKANSIAVLPFLNLSADSDHQIFCDGLSEELLNLLTHVSSLQVAARTSSFALRDSDLDARSIGAKLGVSHILEGSVRRDGEQIRVTAQLVRTSDGFHLWSQNYDRLFTQIFEIQDDIARNIVAQLVTSLGNKAGFDAVPEVERTSPEAYFAYLKGRGALTYPGRDSLLQAAQQFESALAISPDYDPAIIGRLYSQTLLGLRDGQPLEDRRQSFRQALGIFEVNQRDAWTATAVSVLGISLYEWERVRDVLELAIGANRNDVSLAVLNAELLLILNDIDGAAREIERIEGVAPGIPATAYLMALMNYESSEDALETLFALGEWAPNQSAGDVHYSVQNARRQLFQDCSDYYAATDDAAPDAAKCSALGSFLIPLLAIHGRNSEALRKLVAMAEMRTFDGALTRLPEVVALLTRQDAAAAREIFKLPASAFDDNLAIATP